MNNTCKYNYGFRQLDPQLCRWHVVDAMAEKYLSTSPYAYVENNPISFTDYMGLTKMSMEDAIQFLFSDDCEFGGTWTNTGGGSGDVKEHTEEDIQSMEDDCNRRDDYFNGVGNYLGYSNLGCSNIRILTTPDYLIPDGFYLNETMKIIDPIIGQKNSVLLSEARAMGLIGDEGLKNIFDFYYEGDIRLEFGYCSENEAYMTNHVSSKKANRVITVYLYNWDESGFLDNFQNIRNSFEHELFHSKLFYLLGEKYFSLSHNEREAYACFNQIFRTSSWKYTSGDFQFNCLSYASKFISSTSINEYDSNTHIRDGVFMFWYEMKFYTQTYVF